MNAESKDGGLFSGLEGAGEDRCKYLTSCGDHFLGL